MAKKLIPGYFQGTSQILTFFSALLMFGLMNIHGAFIPGPKDVISKFGVPPREQTLPNPFRVLNWNIYKGNKENFVVDFQYFLDTEKPHIITVQEMYDLAAIKAPLKYFENIMAISFWDQDLIATGVLNSSTFRSLKNHFLVSPGTEPVTSTPKMSLITYYQLENSPPLLVANIHGLNFVKSQDFFNQIESVIVVLKNHLGPILFLGDFNTWNLDRSNYLSQRLTYLGLKQVTFSPDHRKKFREYPLDHVFHSEHLKIQDAKVWPVTSSDHNPITLTIEIKKI